MVLHYQDPTWYRAPLRGCSASAARSSQSKRSQYSHSSATLLTRCSILQESHPHPHHTARPHRRVEHLERLGTFVTEVSRHFRLTLYKTTTHHSMCVNRRIHPTLRSRKKDEPSALRLQFQKTTCFLHQPSSATARLACLLRFVQRRPTACDDDAAGVPLLPLSFSWSFLCVLSQRLTYNLTSSIQQSFCSLRRNDLS